MRMSITLAFCLAATSTFAEIKRETVEYNDGETVLEGTLVYDDALPEARDGVLIFHEWAGPGAYELSRATQIAGMGVRPETTEARRAEVMIYYGDRELTRRRAKLALDAFRKQRPVFQQEFVAIGYCFGGMVAIELARAGANLNGVVSFHGSPDTPVPDASNVKCPILVLHGADDPHVKPEQIDSFQREMKAAGVDARVVSYAGAVHRFTNPDGGTNVASGVAYNKEADEQSWERFVAFLKSVFD
jgi:dienelactone hydrolase